jgi:hypothetical protein
MTLALRSTQVAEASQLGHPLLREHPGIDRHRQLIVVSDGSRPPPGKAH